MIYALADLHLDYTQKKSMEIFGNKWKNYQERIIRNWNEIISTNDHVLIAGDISWAIKLEDAYIDLKKIDNLNGKKILMKGNHDYWWQSLNKIRKLDLPSISFLQNNSYIVEDYNICGTRGWICEENINFKENDKTILRRELLRLKMSLDNRDLNKKTIVMLHYPPFDYNGEWNEFFDISKQYGAHTLIYGHLHGKAHGFIKEGLIDGINVHCVSGDYIDFIPIRII